MQRRSRRRKRTHAESEVQLNMAAMLDMAFQLLAFFILTFRASPIEAQIALRLPDSPQVTSSSNDQSSAIPTDPMDDIHFPLPIELYAHPSGELEKVVIGSRLMKGNDPAETMKLFRQEMVVLFETPIFDSVVIRVAKKLHYEPLMQVIDDCTKKNAKDGTPMSKISMVPLDERP